MTFKSDGTGKTGILIDTIRLMMQQGYRFLSLQIIIMGSSIICLVPLIRFLVNSALKESEYSYITANNIADFLLNPASLILFAILLSFVSYFLLFEIMAVILFYSMVLHGEKASPFIICRMVLQQSLLLFRKNGIRIVAFLWGILFFINIPLLFVMCNNIRLLEYSVLNLLKHRIYVLLAPLLFVLLIAFLLQRIFLIQSYLLDKKDIKDAVILNRQLLQKRRFRVGAMMLGWNLCITGFSYLIYFLTLIIAALFSIGLQNNELVIATFLSVNERLRGYLYIAMFIITLISNTAFLTNIYVVFNEQKIGSSSTYRRVLERQNKRIFRHFFLMLMMILAVFNMYLFADIIRKGTPMAYINLDRIQITSHRGFSYEVPENTIPAIEKAIEEQADYIEIDVRQTKDGELVLLHDESLKRTTGLNRNIYDINYEDAAVLDAGGWVDKKYEGTRIPTLREALEICKGRVNLNIEIKYDTHTDNVEERTAALIEEYDMENQCVLTSTSLTCLKNLKMLDPDLKTGYITSLIFERYYYEDYIDFFSIKSYFVTESLMKEVHDHGKEIHAWTVNNKNELERMKRLGVDNIITDNPVYAKEVLYQENTNRLFVTLLKIITE